MPLGQNVYTQWLNDQGGILSDLTITRTGETEFLLVTGDILQAFTPAWLRRHTRPDELCTVTDVTSPTRSCRCKARGRVSSLQALTGADLSTERPALPRSTLLEIGPGSAFAWCGSPIWGNWATSCTSPPNTPTPSMTPCWTGSELLGVPPVHCGLMALECLRLEKGYRDFAVDIDNTDTPLQAGLGFVVDFTKPDFIGRAVLVAQKASRAR